MTTPAAAIGGIMALCPECEAQLDLDESQVDEGAVVSCPDCGSDFEIVTANPLELNAVAGDDEDEDDDEDFDVDEDGDEDLDDDDLDDEDEDELDDDYGDEDSEKDDE
ncbi:MAG: hypothetical protein ACRD13_01060 [Terriglobales bacterium]